MEKKKLSAKEVLQSIRSGLSDSELREKYGISANSLKLAIDKLLELGALRQSELDMRRAIFQNRKTAKSPEETCELMQESQKFLESKEATRIVRVTDEQYEFMRQMYGEDFAPAKPQVTMAKRVTLDSRFTDEELVSIYTTVAMWEQLAEWRNKTFLVRLALGTGLRDIEMSSLRFGLSPTNDVMAEAHWNGAITIRDGRGRKRREARCIPEFYPHYRAHLKWTQNRVRAVEGMLPIFGETYTEVTLWGWWSEVIAKCEGVRPLRLSDARHTYGSWELLRLKEREVKALMGDRKTDVFRKLYAGILAERPNDNSDPEWYRAALGRFAGR